MTITDSADVAIQEIDFAVLEALPVYQIADSPVVSIGALEGEEPYLFSTIRIFDLERVEG